MDPLSLPQDGHQKEQGGSLQGEGEGAGLAAGVLALGTALPPTNCVTLGKWFSLGGPPHSRTLDSPFCGFWSPGCGQGLSGRAYYLHHPGVLHHSHCHSLRVPSHLRPGQRGEYPTPMSTKPEPLWNAVGWERTLSPAPSLCTLGSNMKRQR